MRISYTPEQEELRRELRSYFAALITPERREALMSTSGEYGSGNVYRETVAQMGRDGWLALGWPTEYGGQARSTMDQLIFTDEAAIAGAPNANQINDTVQTQLEKSFAGAESVARQYPQYSDAIQSAARAAFLHGANWAYAAGILAMVVGALVTWFWYPGKAGEAADLAEYARADEQTPAAASR